MPQTLLLVPVYGILWSDFTLLVNASGGRYGQVFLGPAQQQLPILQVIKVGTSSLVRPEQNTLNISNLARLCEVVRELRSQQHR